MRRLLILMAIGIQIVLSENIQADSIIVSGAVNGIWSTDTVWVADDLTVSSGNTLTIEPGVTVLFSGHFKMIVRGSIVALGTEEQQIEFIAADTVGFWDTLSVSGGWGGIFYEHLDPDTDSSLFEYCRFAFGKTPLSGDSIHYYGGAFRIFDFDRIRFSNCIFEHNDAFRWGGGIYLYQANVLIEHCTFLNNRCGRLVLPYGYGGGLCAVKCDPVVQYNTFAANQSTGVGGGASFEYGDPWIQYNLFDGNYSGLGGALCYLRTIPENTCSNNLIINNEARFFGGGISVLRANPVFVNNTLVNNTAVYGGAFYCNDSSFPGNYNCLFYNNFAYEGKEVYIWDVYSAPNFFYCNVPGDTAGFAGSGGHEGYHGIYLHNQDTIPGFREEGIHPFQLTYDSPLRDAGDPDTAGLTIPGKDLGGNWRIYNNRIDIGAYEWNPSPGFGEPLPDDLDLKIFPNPATSHIQITFSIGVTSKVAYSVVGMNGRGLMEGYLSVQKPGLQLFYLELNNLPGKNFKSGYYVLTITTPEGSTGKIFSISR